MAAKRTRRSARRCFALLASLALACDSAPSAPPNILLIVIDTLRADRLGAYGNSSGLTPQIDALAARGTIFEAAYAQSSWTNPSIASVMTSRYQSQHGVSTFSSVLRRKELTLAEVLKANGYATGAFNANRGMSGKRGFDQGFDVYTSFPLRRDPEKARYYWTHQRAAGVNSWALAWLDMLPESQPVFLYVHYMEPHTPYDPPAEILGQVMQGEPLPDVNLANRRAMLTEWNPVDDEAVRLIQHVYDAEVRAADAGVEALLRKLEQRGFLENALVVLTSDHGEEFLEHGQLGHGHNLFNEAIRVPLMVIAPGLPAGRRIDGSVSLLALAPTLLELAGLPVPATFQGRSLVPQLGRTAFVSRLLGRSDPPASALSELEESPFSGGHDVLTHHRALVRDGHKLIAHHDEEMEFYDLRTDAGERDPGAFDEAEREMLRASYTEALDRAQRDRAERLEHALDAEEQEQLRALGYAE